MNDLVVMQYNDNHLRTKQYKNINLYVVKDILRSIVDVEDLDTYWKDLKKQLDSEGFDIYCEISSFPFESGIEECADRATIFRIVQSISSPQAEQFKQWFAEIAEEKIEEYMNPALAIERARDRYLGRGYSPEWIDSRIKSLTTHSQLLDEWKVRGATSKDNEKLANTISQETFGVTIQQHKDIKQITEGSLRDNMSQMELLINSLAELTTSELHKNNNSQGVDELNADAIEGGRAASFAREQIELTLGKPVLTSDNALNFTKLLNSTKDNAPE